MENGFQIVYTMDSLHIDDVVIMAMEEYTMDPCESRYHRHKHIQNGTMYLHA